MFLLDDFETAEPFRTRLPVTDSELKLKYAFRGNVLRRETEEESLERASVYVGRAGGFGEVFLRSRRRRSRRYVR